MTRLLIPEIAPTETNAKELPALLDRLIRCPQFLGAPRLLELLVYIGKQSIVEGRRDLHAQILAVRTYAGRNR